MFKSTKVLLVVYTTLGEGKLSQHKDCVPKFIYTKRTEDLNTHVITTGETKTYEKGTGLECVTNTHHDPWCSTKIDKQGKHVDGGKNYRDCVNTPSSLKEKVTPASTSAPASDKDFPCGRFGTKPCYNERYAKTCPKTCAGHKTSASSGKKNNTDRLEKCNLYGRKYCERNQYRRDCPITCNYLEPKRKPNDPTPAEPQCFKAKRQDFTKLVTVDRCWCTKDTRPFDGEFGDVGQICKKNQYCSTTGTVGNLPSLCLKSV